MLRYGMNIDHLVVIVKLGSVQADAVNFAFAYLVIIRIRPKSLFDRAERRLEFGVCHHPEGIQVAEIKSAAFFIPSAESAASEGEVGMKPAEGCYIELRPVMRADGIRCGREAGLPACRNACDTAEGNEKQGLYTAVPLPVNGTIFRNTLQHKVFLHIGIFYGSGYVIVAPSGFFQRISFLSDNIRSE